MTTRILTVLTGVIGLASAVLFIILRKSVPLSYAVILKVLPTAMMCTWLLIKKVDRSNVLILVGLIFSLTGDIFMELSASGQIFFLIGIIANTLGVVWYTLYFYFSDKSGDFVRLIPVAIVMGVFYFILYDYLGDMKIPVLVYCSIHALFLWRSSARFGEAHISPLAQYVCFIGCVSVTISDFLLSLTLFGVLPDKPKYGSLDMILWWSGLTMLMVTAEIRRRNIKRHNQ